ncbi:uncharacterized protein B0I36DRAFT_31653 [Microdochium trichocladiopsis]|uniref:Uncharacterized protein n=1 Tax=Microdochium trichocladiopsis TaxID=1682393 RepID=A0A9P8XWT3_9PEZI|nr:uncharacterized protein B0I36DRAFT_31653 [Microdochium trichocladiopsis]KAH7021382.1 hypothetical protein B0I36DRAFT_31653 [Microdochium trichocladiopsis]
MSVLVLSFSSTRYACPLSSMTSCATHAFPSPFLQSKVRHPPIVAVVTSRSPPEGLVLGPADLARLWVDVALELWRGALAEWCGCHGVVDDALDPGRRCCRCRCCGCGCGLGGGRGAGDDKVGGGGGGVEALLCVGGALEALELGLFLGGEARGAGPVSKGEEE